MCEVFAESRLHLLLIQLVGYFIFNLVERLHAGLKVIYHFDDFVSGLCLDHGQLTLLHLEYSIVNLRSQRAPLVNSKIASALRRGPFRVALRESGEILAGDDAVVQRIGLFSDGRNFVGCFILCAKENIRQLNCSRAVKFFRMRVVIFLHFFRADIHPGTHFAADHLL